MLRIIGKKCTKYPCRLCRRRSELRLPAYHYTSYLGIGFGQSLAQAAYVLVRINQSIVIVPCTFGSRKCEVIHIVCSASLVNHKYVLVTLVL